MRVKVLKAVFFSVLVVIAVLALFRVPYFGEFVDAVVFTYPFGWAKYGVYLVFFYFCAANVFNITIHKKYLTTRSWIGLIVLFLAISLLFSSVAWWINNSSSPIWSKDIFTRSYTDTTDLWLRTSWPHRQPDEYIAVWGGGLVGNVLFSVLGYTSSIGAFVISALAFIAGVSILFFGSYSYLFRRIVTRKKIAKRSGALATSSVKQPKREKSKFQKANENGFQSMFRGRKTKSLEAGAALPLVSSVPAKTINEGSGRLLTEVVKKNGKKADKAQAAVVEDEADLPKTAEPTVVVQVEVFKKEDLVPVVVEPPRPPKVFAGYVVPDMSSLNDNSTNFDAVVAANAEFAVQKAASFEHFFANFGIEAKVVGKIIGPRVTKFQIELKDGVRVAEITRLEDDIKLALKARQIRIEAPIPGTNLVGVEVPNEKSAMIVFKDLITTLTPADPPLSVALGKDTQNNVVKMDLQKMPHLLVAGATGSGKSVCVSSIITSLVLRNNPNQVKLVLVDPKKVELQLFDSLPHLLTPVINSAKTAVLVLNNLVGLMERRYEALAAAKVRHIDAFNEKQLDVAWQMPYIVVIIDELADLMIQAKKSVEASIMRLTQMARAAGIHIVLATQRPSVDVVTGVIKSNVPSRIAFSVASQVDSRTILDGVGAEKLLGKGDMLYAPVGAGTPERVQGAYLTDAEIEKVAKKCASQGTPDFDPTLLYEKVEDEADEKPAKGRSNILS